MKTLSYKQKVTHPWLTLSWLVQIEYNLVQVASGGYQALNVRGADGQSRSRLL